jgi:hypothetical protein
MQSIKTCTFEVDTVVEKIYNKKDTDGNKIVASRTIYPAGTTMKVSDKDRFSYKFYTLTETAAPAFN